ncbi:M20/M25/M40 family metallo-hydrolase [Sphingomonas sp. LHG3406-1]|uniref:M20/M25/M40 family metallo-hydrolase n=1 Tax=Sphingomonas sp. LHG3406-1 TaxID=2804617 RepID=UPI00262331AF|nr:M20/M25/M40 family metallo-hydrolase [Sphingomonas sp. LHG3406-1]
MRKALVLGLIVLGLLAAMAATRSLTRPPPVRSANAPGQFDAPRARDRLARILGDQAPHPADSAASDSVRDRLVTELRRMGLTPRIDDRFACNGLFKQRGVSCARVRNVIATLGPDNGKPHLLVNSHYDSVPVGPGASDAGMGVAAMLEAASLMKDRPLGRPVTFLFNEGEELGLVGARAFVDADPLSRRVDALINLEARGTAGPVNMFETSLPNRAPVALFRDHVTNPVASSLAVSAYRLIPNYTDVNTFAEERRWLTLNFAPIGNETRYHSPGDDLAGMDVATLQHMGDQLMEVGTALSAGTPRVTEAEMLFTNIGTSFLLTMPFLLGLALAAAAFLLLLRLVWVEKAWGALLLLAVSLAAGTALAWAGLTIVGLAREGQFWRAHPTVTELAIYAGVIAAGLALVGASRFRLPQLRAAWWLLFVGLGLGLTSIASGALIYFVIPPLLYALAATLRRRSEAVLVPANLIAALLVFVMLGGMLGLLQDLLNGGPLWVFALFGGLIILPWLIEARPLLEGEQRRRLLAAALAFAALAWLPAALAPAYSTDRQQQWSLQYVLDSAEKQPVWSVVNDRRSLPGEWRRFGDWRFGSLPFSRRQRWIAPAPLVGGLVPARLIPVEAVNVPGGRRVRLRIEANGAEDVALSAAADAPVRALGMPGLMRTPASEGASGRYLLGCTGRSCDGATFELLLGPRPVEFIITDTRWSLPPAAIPLKAAQPRNARAQYVPDSTLLVSRLRL